MHPVSKESLTFKSVPELNGTWKILEGINLFLGTEEKNKFYKNDIN